MPPAGFYFASPAGARSAGRFVSISGSMLPRGAVPDLLFFGGAEIKVFSSPLPLGRCPSAMAVIRYAERHGTRRPWLLQLMQRRSTKVVAVALANKMARMIWALMTSGERYREPVAANVMAT